MLIYILAHKCTVFILNKQETICKIIYLQSTIIIQAGISFQCFKLIPPTTQTPPQRAARVTMGRSILIYNKVEKGIKPWPVQTWA